MKHQTQLALGVLLAISSNVALSASIIVEGDYIRTAVSDDGTLGFGGTTSPGLLHDPAGTRSYGVDDYITPGTPFEGFSVRSNETGLIVNNNSGYNPVSPAGTFSGAIVDNSLASAYNHSIVFSGSYASTVSISIDTRFNDGDERIEMVTTVTALSDITGVSFGRWIDPDQDVNTFGTHNTINGRGGPGLPGMDWVHSEGAGTGLTLGLYSNSATTHNTSVIGTRVLASGGSSTWSNDPLDYLLGVDDGNGDYSLGIGFALGDLAQGESTTFTYYYILGENIGSIDLPGGNGRVPVPGTLA